LNVEIICKASRKVVRIIWPFSSEIREISLTLLIDKTAGILSLLSVSEKVINTLSLWFYKSFLMSGLNFKVGTFFEVIFRILYMLNFHLLYYKWYKKMIL